MSDKLVSVETIKGLFKLMPANMPFEIAECLLNERLNALPTVPHEMSAVEYGSILLKICASHNGCCSECEINRPCAIPDRFTVPVVEKWAREHPERSEE